MPASPCSLASRRTEIPKSMLTRFGTTGIMPNTVLTGLEAGPEMLTR